MTRAPTPFVRMLASLARALPLALTVALALGSTGCVYARIFYYNIPSLNAGSYFDSRAIAPSPAPLPLDGVRAPSDPPLALPASMIGDYRSLDELLERNDTRSFVVLRDDHVIYERYFGGVTETTALPGFSITKTFAALLVGCAIDDGVLTSVDERLTASVPELSAKPGYSAITIDDLLRMTSGIDFDEESTAGAAFFYTTNLRGRMYDYDVKWRPGTHYLYGSVNIQLLWDVLQRRLGRGTVSQYFQNRVWARLGARWPAAWALDSASAGVEKFFGGLSATTRDFARVGLLYLHRGTFEGHRVVSESWVDASVTPDPVAGVVHTTDGWVRHGKYQWFVTRDGRAFFAKGFRGQYVFVVPAKKLVFARFGEGYGDVAWIDLFIKLSDEVL